MKEIKDAGYIRKVILENEIIKYLDKKEIAFRLFEYEKGEMLIKMNEVTQTFSFVIEGSIQIYGLKDDGTIHPVRQVEGFGVLGDVELIGESEATFFVEAKSNVKCFSFSIAENKEKLLNDNYFLRYLLHSVSKKMIMFSKSYVNYISLEDKLINYMKNECNNIITSVEKTSFQLRCSRRQIQRILKKLLEEGKIKKISKGCYIINNE